MAFDRAELSTLAATLDDVVVRMRRLAEQATATDHAAASSLTEAERNLRAAARRIEQARRAT